jgi:hypothetical protein
MAMKVKAEIVGYGPHPGKTEALVRVSVELDGRRETMEITVLVPSENGESAVRERALARARDCARKFADMHKRRDDDAIE